MPSSVYSVSRVEQAYFSVATEIVLERDICIPRTCMQRRTLAIRAPLATKSQAPNLLVPWVNLLRHHGACRCALIPPGGRQNADSLIVSRQAVNAGFDQDETEL